MWFPDIVKQNDQLLDDIIANNEHNPRPVE